MILLLFWGPLSSEVDPGAPVMALTMSAAAWPCSKAVVPADGAALEHKEPRRQLGKERAADCILYELEPRKLSAEQGDPVLPLQPLNSLLN
jgi:hypothetical protein